MPGDQRLYFLASVAVTADKTFEVAAADVGTHHCLRAKARRKLTVAFSAGCPDAAGGNACTLGSRPTLGEMAYRYTASGYENADLCAWTFGSATFAAGGGLANLRWNCPAAAAKAGCTSRYYLIQVMAGTPLPLNP